AASSSGSGPPAGATGLTTGAGGAGGSGAAGACGTGVPPLKLAANSACSGGIILVPAVALSRWPRDIGGAPIGGTTPGITVAGAAFATWDPIGTAGAGAG